MIDEIINKMDEDAPANAVAHGGVDMNPTGKKKKRDAQKKDCPEGYDYDHRLKKCVKSSENRAGGDGGTKNETTQTDYGY